METKSLSDKLPRKVKGIHQCQALDDDGNKCKNKATIEQYYFGEHEHYSFTNVASWIIVKFCDTHGEKIK